MQRRGAVLTLMYCDELWWRVLCRWRFGFKIVAVKWRSLCDTATCSWQLPVMRWRVISCPTAALTLTLKLTLMTMTTTTASLTTNTVKSITSTLAARHHHPPLSHSSSGSFIDRRPGLMSRRPSSDFQRWHSYIAPTQLAAVMTRDSQLSTAPPSLTGLIVIPAPSIDCTRPVLQTRLLVTVRWQRHRASSVTSHCFTAPLINGMRHKLRHRHCSYDARWCALNGRWSSYWCTLCFIMNRRDHFIVTLSVLHECVKTHTHPENWEVFETLCCLRRCVDATWLFCSVSTHELLSK